MYAFNQVLSVSPDIVISESLDVIREILDSADAGDTILPPGTYGSLLRQREMLYAEVSRRLEMMGRTNHSSDAFKL